VSYRLKERKMAKQPKKTNSNWILWVVIIAVLLIFGGCYAYKNEKFGLNAKNDTGIGNGNDDGSGNGDGTDGGTGPDDDGGHPPAITCYDAEIPQYGDLGPVCAAESCPDPDNCGHYWDYANKEHKCACTETFFCGQYCFAYYYTSGCECPPNSHQEIPDRSHYMCVPDGHYYCEDGQVTEEVGPFPE